MLIAPFQVAPGVFVPPGSYDFADAQVRYLLGNQRRVSGELTLQHGGFYDGTLTAVGYSAARVSVTEQLSVEPAISVNFIDLPYGSFTTQVLRARTDYAFSPRMFASGLVQYLVERQPVQHQPALPVGVSSGERVLPRLHRRARHPLKGRARGAEQSGRREDKQIGQVLTLPFVVRLAITSFDVRRTNDERPNDERHPTSLAPRI